MRSKPEIQYQVLALMFNSEEIKRTFVNDY